MKLVAIALVFAFHTSIVLAQSAPDQKSGRLASGEAYRMNSEGFRMVDQLAELEVTNHDLKRQLNALEDELKEKNATLAKIKGSKGDNGSSAVIEEDLVRSSVSRTGQAIQPTVAKLPAPSVRESDLQAAREAEVQRAREVDLQREIAQLKNSLAQQQELVASLRSEKDRESALQQSNFGEEVASLQKKLDEQKSDISAKEERISTLSKDVEQLTKQQKQNEILLSRVSSSSQVTTVSPSNYSRASLGSEPTVKRIAAEDARKVSAKLSNVQSLIGKRKDLFDSLKRRGGGVSVSIQPLVTGSGESLDQLRLRARQVSSAKEAQEVVLRMQEIEQTLNDDISLLNRLANLR